MGRVVAAIALFVGSFSIALPASADATTTFSDSSDTRVSTSAEGADPQLHAVAGGAAGHQLVNGRAYDDAPRLACAPASSGHHRVAPRAIGPAGNPGALTSPQRAQYLFDNWHPATFPNRTQSINYHLAKHGNGRTAFEYTRDAQQFFSQNRNLATDVVLRDGTAGLRIQTKVPLPGGGTNNVGGYWTSDGRLVTFWD